MVTGESGIEPNEEDDDISDIFRLTNSRKRRHTCEPTDLLLGLALKRDPALREERRRVPQPAKSEHDDC